MSFTWNIKKIDFYSDQVEEKGQIEFEQAIIEFQSFPWIEQLKEIQDRNQTCSLPTITFFNDREEQLSIWTTNIDNFSIYYENKNKYSLLSISYDYTLNSEGIRVEDYIEFFFNGEFEKKVQLEVKPENLDIIDSANTIIEYDIQKNNNMNHLKWTFLYFFIPFGIFILYLFIKWNGVEPIHFDRVLYIQLITIIFWAPGFILYFMYNRVNKNSKLKIDLKNKSFEFSNNKYHLSFDRKNIEVCYLELVKSGNVPWSDFKFLRIELNDGKSLIITSLLADPQEVIVNMGLHYIEKNRYIPFV